MAAVRKVLVVGGGIGGMSTAIQLRKAGIEVDLVEQDKDWQVYGAGITISGPTLRAFKTIGVVDQIVQLGFCADGCSIALANGQVIGEIPTPRIAGPEIPGGGGIMRPVLARILSQATLDAGVSVRLGQTFVSIEQAADKVHVTFTDGSLGEYDLVVGADGLHSKVRTTVFPDAPKPKFTGQGAWRAVVPRPAEVIKPIMFMGHHTKAGVNPVSQDEMYLFFLDKRAENTFIKPEAWAGLLAEELAEFSGLVADIRDGISAQSRIVYRPLESVLMLSPWHSGRVVLMGDAVHATTPHLASGAGIAVEDAIVLAEELTRDDSGLEAALIRYQDRRRERSRLVVENSLRLGEIEQEGGSQEEHQQLMRSTMALLLQPI